MVFLSAIVLALLAAFMFLLPRRKAVVAFRFLFVAAAIFTAGGSALT